MPQAHSFLLSSWVHPEISLFVEWGAWTHFLITPYAYSASIHSTQGGGPGIQIVISCCRLKLQCMAEVENTWRGNLILLFLVSPESAAKNNIISETTSFEEFNSVIICIHGNCIIRADDGWIFEGLDIKIILNPITDNKLQKDDMQGGGGEFASNTTRSFHMANVHACVWNMQININKAMNAYETANLHCLSRKPWNNISWNFCWNQNCRKQLFSRKSSSVASLYVSRCFILSRSFCCFCIMNVLAMFYST